jgi:hypothetical protein
MVIVEIFRRMIRVYDGILKGLWVFVQVAFGATFFGSFAVSAEGEDRCP